MSNRESLVVALYLPQYYETEYNNEWWEKGFTEWMACRRAKPLFKGHNQPRIPADLGFYENIYWTARLRSEKPIKRI